jgi:hypothetical protein
VAIDWWAGPLFSMTYGVFYFFGVAIDFWADCEQKAQIKGESCGEGPLDFVRVRKYHRRLFSVRCGESCLQRRTGWIFIRQQISG